MELFAFQQPSPHPAAEGRVRQVVEDKDRLKNTPEFPHRTIKVVPRPTGEQPFEGHRRGRLTRRKGGEELAHAIPVRGDAVPGYAGKSACQTSERPQSSVRYSRVYPYSVPADPDRTHDRASRREHTGHHAP